MGHVMRKSVTTDTVTVLSKDLSQEKVLKTVLERYGLGSSPQGIVYDAVDHEFLV